VLDLTETGRKAWTELTEGAPRLYEDGAVTVYRL
jgi:hypothetical protein